MINAVCIRNETNLLLSTKDVSSKIISQGVKFTHTTLSHEGQIIYVYDLVWSEEALELVYSTVSSLIDVDLSPETLAKVVSLLG